LKGHRLRYTPPMPAVRGVSLRRSAVRKHSLPLTLATMLELFGALPQEFAEGYLDFIIFFTVGKMLLLAKTRRIAVS